MRTLFYEHTGKKVGVVINVLFSECPPQFKDGFTVYKKPAGESEVKAVIKDEVVMYSARMDMEVIEMEEGDKLYHTWPDNTVLFGVSKLESPHDDLRPFP